MSPAIGWYRLATLTLGCTLGVGCADRDDQRGSVLAGRHAAVDSIDETLADTPSHTTTLLIGDRPCPSCTIRVDTVSVLGDDDGPGLIRGPQVTVSRDATGQFLVGGASSAASISVFDANGRFLRSVGRAGGGPGEYRRIWRIAPFRSGVVVTDDQARRHTMLSSDYQFVRSLPATGGTPMSLVAGSGDRLLEAASVRRGADSAFALFFRDTNGRLVGRASPLRAQRTDAGGDASRRALSVSPDGTEAWATHRLHYMIERCAFRTASCVLLARTVAWFPVPTLLSESSDERMSEFPPEPQLLGAAQEGEQFLWIMSLVPDANWKRGLQLGGVHPRIIDQHRYWDTMIELVDLRSLNVIASQRIDDALVGGPLVGGYSSVYGEDASGLPRIYALRLVLRETSGNQ